MSKSLFRMFSAITILSLMVMALPMQSAAAAAPTELFFSEYIEGSSNHKALEIYNGTGAAVDLAAGGYNIHMSFNGGTSTLTINLTGSVADGDVYVVAHSSADPVILAQADQTNGAGWFNGDDAVTLRKGTDIVDALGQIGFDPGTEWGTGLTSTADNTLRRLDTVCAGDPDASNAFDPAVEWVGFAQNTFDGLGAHTANCGGGAAEPKINEFSASTAGTDVEYVEIFGAADTDYSAYTVLEIEGDTTGSGVVDEVIAVGTTDANGFWLGNLPANALENGTLSLLLVSNFTGALNDDLDTDNDGTFDVTPWDAVVDAVSVNDGGAGDFTYGVPELGPNYDGVSSFAPGGASRIPDGADTEAASDWVRNDFDLAGIPGFPGTLGPGEALNTPGAANEIYVAPPEMCGDPFTPIYDVQGNGAASPLVGTEVALEGVVVGDFQNNASADDGDLNGFHVQDPAGDGDAATSDGVFVYAPGGMDVATGDAVRVRGSVSEYNGMTEVTASQIWVCSSGNTVAPTALSLPVTSLDDFEPYEGMLVTFPQALYISEYFNFDRYGEIVLTSERHLTPTAEVEPGAPAIAEAQEFLLDRITLDDGRTNQNPDPAIHPNGNVFDLTNLFRGGDTVQNVTGTLDYSFNLYRIQPTQGADYVSANPRSASPEDVGGSLKVASFNVLNYFTTIDTGAFICGPAGDQECRGADNAEEFTRQRAKIVAALTAIDADVVGLIEIENHPGDVPTADLVSGLNDVLGAGTYDYIPTGAIGTDAIRVAFIYKPASVSPLGAFAVLDTSVDPRFLDDFNRPALAQSFQDNSTGGIFTVSVNHLKSKGSACDAIGDPDLGDGAGNCNQTRKAAAEALVDWLATDPTGSGDEDFLIIGDLNSYDKEDPIDAIRLGSDDTPGTGDDYTDMIYHFLGEAAYSYVFDGQIGYLDHALAVQPLVDEVTGVTVWHINADEADLIDYDTSFKGPNQDAIYAPDAYRSSDHDPVIVGLDLQATCNGLPATIVGTPGDDVLFGTHKRDVIVALGGNDIIYGGNGDDVICGNAGDDTIYGGNGNDILLGGSGGDALHGGNGNDKLDGGEDADTLTGGNGNDVLTGGSGTDTLIGGTGSDVLDGGADNDALFGNTGNDRLTGGPGADWFSGGLGWDIRTDFNAEEGDTGDRT
ncbi:MAG: ExeM/NucH family extracellular endonuclease [Anaerolineales bacterium]|nr:ExeM/NucH family extracellular endonuclease [Anaerolineales bacterium]